VDDPGQLYRQRRRATQAKGLETLDPKAKVEGPSKSPRESPHPSPKEDQPQQPEREIELCTSDIVDLPIINLQDAGRPFKIKRRIEKIEIEKNPRQLQGPKTAKATQAHSGEMEDHTKKTMKITTKGTEFEMSGHYMKEVVASVKTKGQSQPMKTKNTTKPKNKPVPKKVRKWVPKIATPAKSVDPE
jgi:hypothetical protein